MNKLPKPPEIEICIESLEELELARSHSVHRVELCSALEIGGLSPHPLMVKSCVEKSESVEVHCMVRPRPGDFSYSKRELSQMLDEIKIAKDYGADGVVFGCLSTKKEIDLEQLQSLNELAKEYSLETTFHRAFDLCSDPESAINFLIEIGVDRLLTSGQQSKAIEGLALITNLVGWSDSRIEIMAGSGIDAKNVRKIIDSGVDAIHFSSRKSKDDDFLGFGKTFIPDQEKLDGILKVIEKG